MRKLLLILVALPAWGAYVQSKYCTSAGADATSLSCSFDTPPTVGNQVFVWYVSWSNPATFGTPTDNQQNPYSTLFTNTAPYQASRLSAATVAAASGTFTVTLNFSPPDRYGYMLIAEYRNVSLTVDASAMGFCESGTVACSCGSVTTANPTDTLLVLWAGGAPVYNNGAILTAPPGFTYRYPAQQSNSPNNVLGLFDRSVSAQGPFTPAMQVASYGGSCATIALQDALPPGPPITDASCRPGSPSSVACSWSTSRPADSSILCGASSGGPYDRVSNTIHPVDTVAVSPFWGVTSHSMASNGLSPGTWYCKVSSQDESGGRTYSDEIRVSTAAPVTSTPITVSYSSPVTRLNDQATGANGSPKTGLWTDTDFGYFTWADDGYDYGHMGDRGIRGLTVLGGKENGLSGWARWDKYHTTPVQLGCAVPGQNCVSNLAFTSIFPSWIAATYLSVRGAIYIWLNHFSDRCCASIMKSPDHLTTTLAPAHNLGPDTNSITAMTCSNDTVTVTSKLNISDIYPTIQAPGRLAVAIAGALGSNVNGIYVVTAATAKTISWAQACAGWSWTSGGTVGVYQWDIPTGQQEREMVVGYWVQCDGPDYACTPNAGMDAFVYLFVVTTARKGTILCRFRIEDLPLQDYSLMSCYTGSQSGDDGLYDSAWDSTGNKLVNATALNQQAWAMRVNGKGATPQTLYLADFHRFVTAFEVSDPTDCFGAGSMIFDNGPYPWSPVTLIGDSRRDAARYPAWTAEFPQFIAQTVTRLSADPITVSVALSHSGGCVQRRFDPPAGHLDDYSTWIRNEVVFTARAAGARQTRNRLAAAQRKHVVDGLDLYYDFDVPTGSLSMPNLSPNDPAQRWAWSAVDPIHPLYIDQYGAYNFSAPDITNDQLPVPAVRNAELPTPYRRSLDGPLTVLYCFGHYPTTFVPALRPNAIALDKSGDLRIAWNPETSRWQVTFGSVDLGGVSLADNAIGCLVVRRDANDQVTVYNSAAIGGSLPLAPVLGPVTVSGAWGTSPLVLGDAANSFYGIASELGVWSRDLADEELIHEIGVVRADLARKGVILP